MKKYKKKFKWNNWTHIKNEPKKVIQDEHEKSEEDRSTKNQLEGYD